MTKKTNITTTDDGLVEKSSGRKIVSPLDIETLSSVQYEIKTEKAKFLKFGNTYIDLCQISKVEVNKLTDDKDDSKALTICNIYIRGGALTNLNGDEAERFLEEFEAHFMS